MTLTTSFALTFSALVACAGVASANPIDASRALSSRDLVGLQRRQEANDSGADWVLQDHLVSSTVPPSPPLPTPISASLPACRLLKRSAKLLTAQLTIVLISACLLGQPVSVSCARIRVLARVARGMLRRSVSPTRPSHVPPRLLPVLHPAMRTDNPPDSVYLATMQGVSHAAAWVPQAARDGADLLAERVRPVQEQLAAPRQRDRKVRLPKG